MELKPSENQENERLWKVARYGVLLFCLCHIFFELILGNSSRAALPVVVNFFISAWYIKGRISKGKEMKNLFLMGFSVSGVVFLIRLALGAVLSSLITNS